ncbi:hypothetical protein GGS20DRAFT_357653 [Poronia punctata]|nr:hypothetical protein GGS20DRAFT_357653 [Poronia punctata]
MEQNENCSALREWVYTWFRGRKRVKEYKDLDDSAGVLTDLPSPIVTEFKQQPGDVQLAAEQLPTCCPLSVVPEVGLPPDHTTRGFPFLSGFPSEIRNLIYEYSLQYPTCCELFDAFYKQLGAFEAGDGGSSPLIAADFTIKLFTPTILLLCKQITGEALVILRKRPFVIDRVPPWVMGRSSPLPLTGLIGCHTLQRLRWVEIRLSLGDSENLSSGEVWIRVLDPLLKAWSVSNTLARLKIMIKVNNLDVTRLWEYERRRHDKIVRRINRFAFKHGGKPNLVEYEYWIIDHQYAFRCGGRNPLIRKHPDPYIWQGSVLEWV